MRYALFDLGARRQRLEVMVRLHDQPRHRIAAEILCRLTFGHALNGPKAPGMHALKERLRVFAFERLDHGLNGIPFSVIYQPEFDTRNDRRQAAPPLGGV